MKLKSAQELKDMIDGLTMDIEFSYKAIDELAICPYTHSEIECIGEIGSQMYSSSDDVLDNFIIDGKPLREIATEIEL